MGSYEGHFEVSRVILFILLSLNSFYYRNPYIHNGRPAAGCQQAGDRLCDP
jgi:hypothetical protein